MLKSLKLPEKIEIVSNGIKSKAYVVAHSNFSVGDVIYVAQETLEFDNSTYQTVQVNQKSHLLDPVFAHLNHSCDPNTYIDCSTQPPSLIAQKDILAGEELTFFYPSTEWQMIRPFICACGASNCLIEVAGAQKIPSIALQSYRLNKHVRELL